MPGALLQMAETRKEKFVHPGQHREAKSTFSVKSGVRICMWTPHNIPPVSTCLGLRLSVCLLFFSINFFLFPLQRVSSVAHIIVSCFNPVHIQTPPPPPKKALSSQSPMYDVLSGFFSTFWTYSVSCVCSSGERPFCCQLCPYRASQKGNLKTHVQSVHHMPFDNSQYPDTRSLLLSPEEPEPLATKRPPMPQRQ